MHSPFIEKSMVYCDTCILIKTINIICYLLFHRVSSLLFYGQQLTLKNSFKLY